MTTARNKEVFRRFIEAVLGARRLEIVPGLVSDDSFDHAALPGADAGSGGLTNKVEAVRRAFPDLATETLMLIREGDMVATRIRVRVTGTRTGRP